VRGKEGDVSKHQGRDVNFQSTQSPGRGKKGGLRRLGEGPKDSTEGLYRKQGEKIWEEETEGTLGKDF